MKQFPRAVVAPIAVAVVVRAVFAYTDNIVSPDEAAYLGTGHNIWHGHGITYLGEPQLHFPPLLPLLLGGLAKVLPEPHHATVLVTFLASVALVPVLGALAWRVGGRRAGVLALWFAALTPGLSRVVAWGAGGSEALYTAVLFGAALVAVGRRRWDDPVGLPRAAAVGALVGAAYLLRPEGILTAAVFGAILAVRVLKTADWRRLFAVGAACLAGLAVFAGPYVWFLHSHTGHWSLTAKSVDVSIEAWHAVAAQERDERDTYLYKLDDSGRSTEQKTYALTALARRHPRSYLNIVGENIKQLYKSLLSPNVTTMPGFRLIAVPLIPFALFAAWRHRRTATVVAVVGVLLLSLATVIGFFVLNRYLPPAISALVVLAAIGLAELQGRAARIWITVGLVTSVMSLATWFEGAHGPTLVRERPDLQLAARWLRNRVPAGATVMTRSTALPYYLPNNKLLVPPVGTVAQVWRYSRFNHVGYFLFDPTTQLYRQGLAPLTDGKDHSAEGFELLHVVRVEDRETFIYRILRQREPAAP
ncbi:MAG TPA: hypothetical protein VMZ22_11795 [Acidimicrobiales bacterium]|nr:hypothetical protein [Acidimicrobiales bacterium]